MHGSTTAEWITAIAAALAFFGAAFTIVDNRRTARQRVTYEYIARLEAPALIEHQAVMSSFLRGGLRPPSVPETRWATMGEAERLDAVPAVWEHLSGSSSVDDRRTVLQILAYPNMLEGLAGMYNHGLLDRRIVKVEVESEAKSFWERAKWWRDELKEGDGNTFRDLEVMIEDLAKRKRPRPY
jgi:hypothetical protein